MAQHTRKTGLERSGRGLACIFALAAAAIACGWTVAEAEQSRTPEAPRQIAAAAPAQTVALLVPRRIRLIIKYHRPREA